MSTAAAARGTYNFDRSGSRAGKKNRVPIRDSTARQPLLVSLVQGMKSKQIYSSSRRRNLKGPEIQFYKTNCFLNHPFDSVVDKGNNSKMLSTGVDVVRL